MNASNVCLRSLVPIRKSKLLYHTMVQDFLDIQNQHKTKKIAPSDSIIKYIWNKLYIIGSIIKLPKISDHGGKHECILHIIDI